MDAWLGRRKAKNEYKSIATRLSLWGQSRGVPGASPAWATRLARRIASSSNPKLTERFIRAKNGAAVWDAAYVAQAARGNEVKVDIGTRMSVR